MIRSWLGASFVVLVVWSDASCTRPNDSYCCTEASLCDDVGGVVDDCPGENQVCDDDGQLAGTPHTCITDPSLPGCDDTSECPSDLPVCVSETCTGCEGDGDCERFPDTPACSADGACTECHAAAIPAESIECPAGTPVCDADGACRGCTDHRECASGACALSSGACEPDTRVVYVDGDAGGGSTTCTLDDPCDTIEEGLAATSATRPYLVIADGNYDADLTVIDADLTIIGYGATVTAASNGPALQVGSSDASVSVWGLTITDSPTGIDCNGLAASTVELTLGDVTVSECLTLGLSTFRCQVTILRSRFSSNAQGGAVIRSSDFDITNSFFDGNGGASQSGGVWLDTPPTDDVRFAFNTIVDNLSSSADEDNAPGLRCDALFALPAFHSNLITANTGGSGAQVSATGVCSYEQSLINPAEPGTGNIEGDAALDPELHLGGGSVALGAGRSGSGVLDDYDRDVRPAEAPDIGADERP